MATASAGECGWCPTEHTAAVPALFVELSFVVVPLQVEHSKPWANVRGLIRKLAASVSLLPVHSRGQ